MKTKQGDQSEDWGHTYRGGLWHTQQFEYKWVLSPSKRPLNSVCYISLAFMRTCFFSSLIILSNFVLFVFIWFPYVLSLSLPSHLCHYLLLPNVSHQLSNCFPSLLCVCTPLFHLVLCQFVMLPTLPTSLCLSDSFLTLLSQLLL